MTIRLGYSHRPWVHGLKIVWRGGRIARVIFPSGVIIEFMEELLSRKT